MSMFQKLRPLLAVAALAGVTGQAQAQEAKLTYAQIVQAASRSLKGAFPVYEVQGQYIAEVPRSALNIDLLWYAELGAGPPGSTLLLGVLPLGNALGEGNGRLVRLQRSGAQLLVLDYTLASGQRAPLDADTDPNDTDAEKTDPIQVAVGQGALPSVMLAIPVLAEGPGGAALVNLSGLFGADIPQLSAQAALVKAGFKAAVVDPRRSAVTRVSAYPDNLFVTNLLTFVTAEGDAVSVETKHSLLVLPRTPMRPRLADSRVGYFSVGFTEFSDAGAAKRNLVVRYRLEKKNPAAAVSDPVKPIVYYIGPGVPNKWRPYIKAGIASWNEAFRGAGFSNAIVARDAPTRAQDPGWDPGDARYNVVRWLAQPAANAQGANLHDPRTGEVISANILLWPQVLDLIGDWYFSMLAPLDPRARRLPLPDEVVGAVLRYAVAHEVGHTLGLRHNHRASTAYTVAQLRDPAFACANGSVASIMAYGRLNYVAQPEDRIRPDCLLPRIAAYDRFAIRWGYTPVPGARTPSAELPALNAIARQAATNPLLRYGTDEEADKSDPTVLRQNVGAERVEATRLGMENLKRAMALLPGAALAVRSGEGAIATMRGGYAALLAQRAAIAGSVLTLVGGVVHERTLDARTSQYRFVPAGQQRRAVAYLNEGVFSNAEAFLPPGVLAVIEGAGATNALVAQQRNLLQTLLSRARLERLTEAALLSPGTAYPVEVFLNDLQSGLWSELGAAQVRVSPLRRDLQRAYLDAMKALLAPPAPPQVTDIATILREGVPVNGINDGRGAVLLALAGLSQQVKAAAGKAADTATAAYLAEVLASLGQ